MKRFKGVKGAILLLIMAGLIVGYYFYLSTRTYETPEYKDENVMTQVQKTLSRSMANDYPPTPKEVVKYMAEINRCYYNEEHTEEELAALVARERELYDTELASYNTEAMQLLNITKEIEAFKTDGYYISNVEFTQSIDVEEWTYDGSSWALLYAKYTLKKGSMHYISNYKYLLRKDDAGHYKIYGWTLEKEDDE